MRNRKPLKVSSTGEKGISVLNNKFEVAFRYLKIRYRAYFYTIEDAK